MSLAAVLCLLSLASAGASRSHEVLDAMLATESDAVLTANLTGASRSHEVLDAMLATESDAVLTANLTGKPACEMVDRKYEEALGGVQQDVETPTAAACLELCRKTPKCGKYTWYEHDGAKRGNCWLNPASAKMAASYHSMWGGGDGAVCGPKDCDPCAKSYMYAAQSSGYWSMPGMGEMRGITAESCMWACQGNQKCKYWTFKPKDGLCYLADENALLRKHGEATMTGDRNCVTKVPMWLMPRDFSEMIDKPRRIKTKEAASADRRT